MGYATGSANLLHPLLLGAAVFWLALAMSGRLNRLDASVGLLGAMLLILLASYYDDSEFSVRPCGHPVARWWYLYAAVLSYLGLRAARRRAGAPSSREDGA